MTTAYANQINSAVGAARGFKSQIEAALASGKTLDDSEVASWMDSYDRALDDADKYKRLATNVERETSLESWMNEPQVPGPASKPNGDIDPTAAVEYAEAFVRYAQAIARQDDEAAAKERRVLTIAVDSDGGYTVPKDNRSNILTRIPAASPLLGLVQSFPTSRDIVSWNRIVPNASSPSIYTSAFVGSMVGEQPAGSDGDAAPEFGQFDIPIRKARSKALLSMDLVADSEYDMMNLLETDGAVNMALLRESQIVAGTGIGKNALGLFNMPTAANGSQTADQIGTIDIEGSSSNLISNTTSSTGSAPKLFDLLYAVPAQYRRLPSFRWLYNSQTEKKIRKLVDANGQFLWTPGFAGTPNELLGHGSVISEFAPDDGTDANKPIACGDMNQIVVPVRQSIAVQVLMERYAELDQIAVLLRQRFGVGVANTDAIRIGIV